MWHIAFKGLENQYWGIFINRTIYEVSQSWNIARECVGGGEGGIMWEMVVQ